MISKCFLLAIKLCLSASIVTGVVLLLRRRKQAAA